MKKSNIVSIENKISVKIFDGLDFIIGSDLFTSKEAAKASAERLIKFQKELLNTTTAYAMVFEGKKMIYYFE